MFHQINPYLKEFFDLKCIPDIISLKLFPNLKEVTESMGAFYAVQKYILDNNFQLFKNPKIAAISVGDGSTPRTAALFAFRTNWNCYSIDPMLHTEREEFKTIRRLTMIKDKVENVKLDLSNYEKVIILLVHSHAGLKRTLNALQHKNRSLVTIPCCVPHEIADKPYIGYVDTSIATAKNTVKIWRNI
jgi:hypothetical protein